MAEQKKEVRKNPHPLVVKGTFFVTAQFEDKRYLVSNGLSFIQFAKEDDGISKGDYVSVHGPVYQRKEAANPIITGEAIVKKLSEKEVEKYKSEMDNMFKSGDKKEAKKSTAKKAEKKSEENKMPWE